MSKQLTLIDLFAGCGGLSLGLEQAGFLPVFVSELNHDAMQTYLVNRISENPLIGSHAYHVHDIKEVVESASVSSLLASKLETRPWH